MYYTFKYITIYNLYYEIKKKTSMFYIQNKQIDS